MSDTSVVFNVIGRERVGQALSRVRSLFRSAGQEAQRATRAAAVDTARLDKEIHDVERSLASLNAEFAATGNKELFAKMKRDRSLLTQLKSVRKELGATNDEARRLSQDGERAGSVLSRLGGFAAGVVSSGLENAGSALTNLTTNVWNLIPAALAAAAGLAALGPAAYLAGGAIGALPGIIAGAAAALAVFKLGFMGLGEAYKKATTATGGGASAARDMTSAHRAVESAAKGVTRAERDVADALLAARKAHLAVADAVSEERRRRGELNRDLEAARIDEEDAAAAVTQAEHELTAARANGMPADVVAELDRAYRRAQLNVQNTQVRVKDLASEQKDAAQTGVQGSDLVVQAKEREAEAVRRVTDAQDQQKEAVQRLADAQKALNAPAAGGGGGGGLSSPKLAPSAQKFLDVILKLRPAFDRLRLGVQEKLFSGLSTKLQTLASAWMPALTTSLGKMATTFNGIFGRMMKSASKPKFITDVTAGIEGFRVALDKVGTVASGPLMTAFGQLSKASKPFTEALGGEVADLLGDFSKKIDELSKNGKLDKFFTDATDVMKDAFRILKSIGSIGGSVMKALFGGKNDNATGPWKAFANVIDDIAAWFKNPQNIAMIQGWITDAKAFGTELKDALTTVKPLIGPVFWLMKQVIIQTLTPFRTLIKAIKWVGSAIKWVGDNAPKWWAKVSSAFTTAKNWVVTKGGQLVTWFRGLGPRLGRAASGMWNGLKNSFKSAINWIVGRWNNLSFTIGGGSFLGTSIPSARFDTPDIPYLAKGGTAVRGGLSMVGEKGPELLNMPRGASVIPLNRAGGPTRVELSLAPGVDGALGRAIMANLRYKVRTEGQGNVQKLLGARA